MFAARLPIASTAFNASCTLRSQHSPVIVFIFTQSPVAKPVGGQTEPVPEVSQRTEYVSLLDCTVELRLALRQRSRHFGSSMYPSIACATASFAVGEAAIAYSSLP